MNIKKILFSFGAFSLLLTISVCGKAQKIHPMTQAMLDGYDELLKQNPEDWFTLYERASQYYRLNMYDKAEEDILKAIRYTPAKEKDQLSFEHFLASDIYTQKGDYQEALRQIDKALEYSPGSYPLLYQKGNICLYLNQTDEARKCFNAMLRLKSRSQEAVFGLAKAAVIDGNNSEARSYMEQAEKIDPSNFITYCRIGDLYADMDEVQNAAANYLSAFSLNSRDERSLTSLLELGRKNYDGVAEALDYAISKTSNTVPLYFLKGNIAKNASRYDDAYEAYKKLLTTTQGNSPEVLLTMAEICRDKNSLTEALGYADRSVALSPSKDNITLKASIQYDLGSYKLAKSLAEEALTYDADNIEAMLIEALSDMALEEYENASTILSNALAIDPNDYRLLLLRGYIADNFKVPGLPGKNDYVRASNIPVSDDTQLLYKAISQSLSGKTLDATSTISPLLEKADKDGDSAYKVAVFYAATGNIEKGREFLNKAKTLGFGNIYLLDTYSVPLLSVAPLR